jgi:hypothetical protein
MAGCACSAMMAGMVVVRHLAHAIAEFSQLFQVPLARTIEA